MSMEVAKLALAVAAMACAASPAAAQIGGSRLNRVAESEDAAEVVRRFSACVADIDAAWTQSLLEALPGSRAELEILAQRKSYDNRCLIDSKLRMDNRQIVFKPTRMRALIGAHLGTRTARTRAKAPPQGAAMQALEARIAAHGADVGHRGRLFSQMLGSCLVDERWPLARTYLLSKSGSSEEATALAAISPALSGCMPSGAKMTLDHATLRGAIGEAVYHAYDQRAEGSAN